MNLRQLRKQLRRKLQTHNTSYPIQIYHPWELLTMKYQNVLEVRFPSESFCIKEKDGLWRVFYVERGSVSEESVFEQEKEACEYFIEWISKVLK